MIKSGFIIAAFAATLSMLTLACSSSGSAPRPSDKSSGQNTPAAEEVGPLAAVAPPAGDYTAHYVRKAGDPMSCPDLADMKTTLSDLSIDILQPPNCTSVADPKAATLTTHCEVTSNDVKRIDHTVATVAKTGLTGTMQTTVRGRGIDTDCTYEFSYTR
jgi:hypothetical protein